MAETREQRIKRQLESALKAGNQQDVATLKNLQTPTPVNKADKIQSQIDEATAAGNFEDVATLQGLRKPQKVEPVESPVSDSLKQQSDAVTKSLVSQLKQRISESVATQKGLIEQAPQKYDPLRAQSEVAKASTLRGALERASVRGDRGGIGRSEALATQTAGEQRLGDINLAQQNEINQANQEIARLENEGRFQEAAIRTDQKQRLLSGLMGEQVRQEGIAREDTIRSEGLALDEKLRTEATATRDKEAAFNQELQTISQYSGDYQAEIDRRTAIDPNDPLIPYLRTARQQKIAGIEQAEAESQQAALDAQNKSVEDNQEIAFKLWEKSGEILNDFMADWIGLPIGTKTDDARYKDAKLKIDQYKAYKSGKEDTEKLPTKGDWWNSWDSIQQEDPELIDQWLDSNATSIINALSRDSYNEMVAENKKNKIKKDVGNIGNVLTGGIFGGD